ncbi:hypothetical protein KIS1582_5068 [Cytobacillus firmus]|uniref:Uncharacterized protein n=1 Tax=Cytobacillus firmus TaxID=1399 RepID=A0A800MRV0_CYTFI|nr:hypothetical protein KIS1582_5068 [Cytobacillus firmus]
MYKHEIHKSFTYLFFFVVTIIFLISTVPNSFQVDEYTYVTALIFSIIGTVCFSEIYFGLHIKIKDKDFLAQFVRNFFLISVFLINCSIVLLGNWFVLQSGLVDTLNYTWYTVISGFIWLISFHIAKIVPNLPEKLLKKKEQ